MNLPARFRPAKRPPTDFELLRAIYERHGGDHGYGKVTASGQKAEVPVPIDIPALAADLGVDIASVHGRLHHHLDPKYGEPAFQGKPRRFFFSPVVGNETNCVNFLLEAVVADLWEDRNRARWVTATALASIAIALSALIVSIVVAVTG
ncbi:MAG TPA: hypothetical protein VFU51_03995 [Gaiellaceae bacterium]|nr:hypothetical protein [Gaiellaceae bacterium]